MARSASQHLRLKLTVWLGTLGLCLVVGLVSRREEHASAGGSTTLFDGKGGCAIVLPMNPLPQERVAAELVQHTFAVASGLGEPAFPISIGHAPGRAFVIGRQVPGLWSFVSGPAKTSLRSGVGLTAIAGRVHLWSERRESIASAAAWFLERHLGAHWFIPGPLGEEIPRRAALTLPSGTESAEPGFISRDLQAAGDPPGAEWYTRNKLEARLEHGHALSRIFTRRDFERHPEMAPLIDGKKYLQRNAGDYNWQPDLTSPATVQHAAVFVGNAIAADRNRLSISICENDSIRFDESAATRAVVEPLRYFRHRPDYSDLVFGFSNRVAEAVHATFPERYVGAYAYYWSENAPRFKIAPNLVPWLTADRSQWFEPSFAAEDRDLIERWCHSGARIVGLYDYLEGDPYLVPRPVLYNVTQAIPFAYRAGARAYFGEGVPNWALDGPKLWLAAQLLWSPTADPHVLLDTYYREFWREAAAPMGAFYERCDRVWQNQPRPGYWIKYYGDEHQACLFPPDVRAELRNWLAAAKAAAKTDIVRARVSFVREGFDVTDRFCAFVEQRDRVWRLAHARHARETDRDTEFTETRPEVTEHSSDSVHSVRSSVASVTTPSASSLRPLELFQSWQSMLRARSDFVLTYARVRCEMPLAIGTADTASYRFSDPSAAVIERLDASEPGRDLLRQAATAVELITGGTPSAPTPTPPPLNRLRDAMWSEMELAEVAHQIQFRWTPAASPWRGTGEPWETRQIRFAPAANGGRALHFEGCQSESLGQWVPAERGATYVARVHFRGHVSPGNEIWLLVSTLDAQSRYVGTIRRDRVPPGEWTDGVNLTVMVRLPPTAAWVGYALRVGHQVNDDFAEFSAPSLEVIPNRSDR